MTRPGPTSVLQSGSVYLLTVGGFIGEGNDHFASHPLNGMKFSTSYNDNDQWSSGNCAANDKSGWWHNNCRDINTNRKPL